jgi:hypothetical protein
LTSAKVFGDLSALSICRTRLSAAACVWHTTRQRQHPQEGESIIARSSCMGNAICKPTVGRPAARASCETSFRWLLHLLAR